MKRLFLILALALSAPAFATVYDTSLGRTIFSGVNGSQTVFTFSFPASSASDIVVTVLVNGSLTSFAKTITLNADQSGSPGGTVTFNTAPTAGASVTVERDMSLNQTLGISPYFPFPAKAVEKNFDRTVLAVQQVQRSVNDLAAKETADISAVISGGQASASLIAPTGTGSSVARTLGTRFAEVVSVLDYGAICDGVTDTTTQVTAARTAASAKGALLIFPTTQNCVTTIPGMGTVGPGSIAQTGPTTALSRFMVAHVIEPIRPSLHDPLGFPEGDDLQLQVAGSADIHLANNPIDLTATTSLTAGVPTLVSVGSTAGFCLQSNGCSIFIEPASVANNEGVGSASWSVTDGTHLTITSAKNHTQPYTIRQVGGQFIDLGQALGINFGSPETTFYVLNGEKTGNIFKLEEQTTGGVLRLLTNGSTVLKLGAQSNDYARLYGTSTATVGGFQFYSGQATAQKGQFIWKDNEADGNQILVADTNNKKVSIPQGALGSSTASNTDLNGVLTSAGNTATYTFVRSYTSAPTCYCSVINAGAGPYACWVNTASNTAITFKQSGGATDQIMYSCFGRN